MRAASAFLIAITALAAMSRTAQAQLYVTQLVGLGPAGVVSQYQLPSGTLMNANFITGLQGPVGLAVMGSLLFVANQANNTVDEYDAGTGAPINPTFIAPFSEDDNPTGVSKPTGLAVMGNMLYVSNFKSGIVGGYDISTGAANAKFFIRGLTKPAGLAVAGGTLYVASCGPGISTGVISTHNSTTGGTMTPNFITGLSVPAGIVFSGNVLYVSNEGSDTVGAYDPLVGTAIQLANPITGLNTPTGLAVSGGTLFVANALNGTIGAYNANTGAPINPTFIAGLNFPAGLAVNPTFLNSTRKVTIFRRESTAEALK